MEIAVITGIICATIVALFWIAAKYGSSTKK